MLHGICSVRLYPRWLNLNQAIIIYQPSTIQTNHSQTREDASTLTNVLKYYIEMIQFS
jgi:hypothetical protein